MAQLLPPTPVGVPPGHSFWNDWYEKMRTLINNVLGQVGTFAVINEDGYVTDGVHLSGDATDADNTGLVLTSPDGAEWRVLVSNGGTLSVALA